MKKVIIKSITITLILILLFTTIFSVVLCVFYPKTVSDLSYRVGNYEIAVTYSEKDYLKNKTCDNLVDLVEKAIVAKKYDVVSTYASILLVDEQFRDVILPTKQVGYFDYVASSLVKALYKTNEFTKSVKCAINYTDFNVDGINATTTLISLCIENNDKTVLALLLDELNLLENTAVIELYKQNLNTILQN